LRHDHSRGGHAAPDDCAMRPSSETYNDPSETNMPLIFQDIITENDLIDHPDRLYLFGDYHLARVNV
jgi:hypothetical protein